MTPGWLQPCHLRMVSSSDGFCRQMRTTTIGAMGRRLMWIGALALLSVATRWLSLAVDVVDVDEACHIVGSWQLMRGGLLYTDFVDNKPPLLYAFYAAAQALAGRGLFAVHLATALCVVPFTALAVSACYRQRRTGLIAALTFLLYSSAFLGHDMLATNAEVLMVLPASWAIVLMADDDWTAHRGRAAAAGFLLGIGVLFKPQIATWILAALVALAWPATASTTRERLRAASLLIVGAIVPTVGALLYFWARGGLSAFVYWAGLHNLWYADNPITGIEAATRFTQTVIPFALVTSPLWLASWRGYSLLHSSRWQILVIGLIVASVPPALLGFRFFPHYLIQLYVPLSLSSAPWLEQQLTRPITRAGRWVLVWTTIVVAGFGIANALLYFGPFHVYRERDPVFRSVARRLLSDSCARNGSLFVWGWAPMIYYFADLSPGSRFVALPQAQLTGYIPGNLSSNRGESPGAREVPEHWDLLMKDLDRSHVTFIVDTAPANVFRWGRYPLTKYPRLLRYVETSFVPASTIAGIDIYRRRDCATAADSTRP